MTSSRILDDNGFRLRSWGYEYMHGSDSFGIQSSNAESPAAFPAHIHPLLVLLTSTPKATTGRGSGNVKRIRYRAWQSEIPVPPPPLERPQHGDEIKREPFPKSRPRELAQKVT